MREQTPVVRLLQDIFDLVSAAFGSKDPYPRPVSAVELALEDARTDHLHNFRNEAMKALLPNWDEEESLQRGTPSWQASTRLERSTLT